MKNKYLEVEALPFASQEQNSPFKVRPLNRDLGYKKASPKFNKKIGSLLIRSIFVLLLFSIPLHSSGQITFKEKIITQTNQERKAHQKNELKVNHLLEKAALKKAQDMLERRYFDHTTPEGGKAWDFILKEGYNYNVAGENLAIDFSSPERVVEAWMASETHRNNILDDDFREIGVAVLEGDFGEDNTHLVVQIFGTEDK